MKKTLLFGAMILFGTAVMHLQAGPAAPVAPAPAPAPAAVPMFTYDFLDVQYIYTDFDSPWMSDGHGVGANLSKSVGGPVYVTSSFAWTDTDYEEDSIDLYGASAGVGAYLPVMDRLHLNFEGGAVWSRDDYGYESQDDWGFFVGPGMRFSVMQGLEIFANVYYFDFGGDGDTNGFDVNVGAIYDISQYFGLKVGGLFGEDANSLFVGGRVYY